MATLLEILAEELKEWPGDRPAISQDCNGMLNKLDFGLVAADVLPIIDGLVWTDRQWTAHSSVRLTRVADDFKTAVVTKEQWLAARR